ncbi:MAG: AbrB/MazE/SpoVT family DNA-binding domain-containing protein [Candidatus Nanoarchaeia archaeon]
MRRKLIKQGIDGLTLYVPKKWTEKYNLKGGDEIEFSDIDGDLRLSPAGKIKEIKSIELKAENTSERAIRTLVGNAYRAGYDKIILHYEGKESTVKDLINTYLIGFEIFRQENTYSIESIAEPTYEDFDKIIQKLFTITLEIYKNFPVQIEDYVNQVQRYSNFLKRCISKNLLNVESNVFLWQFISDLAHVAREAHHFKDALKKFNPNQREQELLTCITEMIRTLQKGYLKKDVNLLITLHNVEENMNKRRNEIFSKTKDPIIPYYLFHIIRYTYLSSSSLVGALQVENMKKKNNISSG